MKFSDKLNALKAAYPNSPELQNNAAYMAGRNAMAGALEASPVEIPADAGFIKRLFGQLYGSKSSSDFLKHVQGLNAVGTVAEKAKGLPEGTSVPIDDAFKSSMADDAVDSLISTQGALESPLSVAKNADGFTNLGTTASLLGANIKANPWKSGLTAANAVGNVVGAFDNDKILGQAVGTVGGALLPKVLGLGPFGTLNAAMLGGNLGMLFDKLREKREKEAAAQLPAEYTTY